MAFIRMAELATIPAVGDKPARKGRLPVSPATIWRWSKAGDFPEPVKLSGSITAWPVEAIDKWEAERAAASEKALQVSRKAREAAAAKRVKREKESV